MNNKNVTVIDLYPDKDFTDTYPIKRFDTVRLRSRERVSTTKRTRTLLALKVGEMALFDYSPNRSGIYTFGREHGLKFLTRRIGNKLEVYRVQ